MADKCITTFPDCGNNVDSVTLIGYGPNKSPKSIAASRISLKTDLNNHKNNPNAHQDIRESIPTKTSDLENDSGFLTSKDVVVETIDLSTYTDKEIIEEVDYNCLYVRLHNAGGKHFVITNPDPSAYTFIVFVVDCNACTVQMDIPVYEENVPIIYDMSIKQEGRESAFLLNDTIEYWFGMRILMGALNGMMFKNEFYVEEDDG